MPKTKKDQRLAALERQVARVETRLQTLHAESDQLSRIRMFVFIGGMLASLLAFYLLAFTLGAILALATVVVFGAAVTVHRRVDRSLVRHQHWITIKRAHIARMMLDWDAIPPALTVSMTPDHPFESDLNLTGERSIHHLIDTAVSQEGSERLRAWLLEPLTETEAIYERQRLVQQLAPLALFRDKLTLEARLTGSGRRIQAQRVLDWIASQHIPGETLRPIVRLSAGLAALNILSLILTSAFGLPPFGLITFAIYVAIWGRQWEPLSELFETSRALYNTLERLQSILGYLETYRGDRIQALLAVYHEHRPSVVLRQLTRIVAAASLQGNPFFWLAVNLVVPWDLFFAERLNHAKRRLADELPIWLDAWFELEALNALANFAYLNPHYNWPQLREAPGFEAQALGHPLLPAAKKVCNDFTLENLGSVVIITGSNMSGKSTFLRTVGVNLVLTYAGGPVNAAHFITSRFCLFSCINVSDSLNDGISYFYAEVKRLKSLLDALQAEHSLPLFFLIDEIFRGTNNRERLIGSRAYIEAVAKQEGMGFIATHDLELVKLADDFPTIVNYHFREEVQAGQMVFDYQIRPGPCPTTNALKIMALEGLPTP